MTKSAAQLNAEIKQHAQGGDRVVADLTRWGIDSDLVGEVREAFRTGNHKQAMALARDLGWNRTAKRGRSHR